MVLRLWWATSTTGTVSNSDDQSNPVTFSLNQWQARIPGLARNSDISGLENWPIRWIGSGGLAEILIELKSCHPISHNLPSSIRCENYDKISRVVKLLLCLHPVFYELGIRWEISKHNNKTVFSLHKTVRPKFCEHLSLLCHVLSFLMHHAELLQGSCSCVDTALSPPPLNAVPWDASLIVCTGLALSLLFIQAH